MNMKPIPQFAVILLAAWGPTSVSPAAFAGGSRSSPGPQTATPRPAPITDVVLDALGSLTGRVVDRRDRPLASVVVTLQQGRRRIARVRPAADGRFKVTGLPIGLYRISAGSTSAVYRVWSTRTAPRKVAGSVLLVVVPTVVRGQNRAADRLDEIELQELLQGRFAQTGLVVGAAALGAVIGFNTALDDRPAVDRAPASP